MMMATTRHLDRRAAGGGTSGLAASDRRVEGTSDACGW
jgi:hypothetical protein